MRSHRDRLVIAVDRHTIELELLNTGGMTKHGLSRLFRSSSSTSRLRSLGFPPNIRAIRVIRGSL